MSKKIEIFPTLEVVIPLQCDPLRSVLKHEDRINIDSDITLLMNEKRIANDIGVVQMLKERFEQENVSHSPYDGMTDDEIFQNIPSRSFQSVAERKAWVEYMADAYQRDIESLNSQLSELKEPVKEEVNE